MDLDPNTEPQQEPVVFELDEDAPEELLNVQLQIKGLAEKSLFQWKTFPIVLPPSVTEQFTTDEDGNVSPIIMFKDLFLAPTFDELEEVAKDNLGDLKSLNDAQLESVRKRGEFDVNSVNFPGQIHTWRLTQLLQKGSEKSRDTLYKDAALAVELIIVNAKNRFKSHFFSVSEGFRHLTGSAWQLLDCAIGLPHTSPSQFDSKLHAEHMKFLVAELSVRPSSKEIWSIFSDFVLNKWRESDSESNRGTHEEIITPLPPYKLQTAKGQEIDLRLFNIDLMSKCRPALMKILEREGSGWYIKFKDRLIADMQAEEMTVKEITEHVNKQVQEEYLRRIFTSIQRSEELEALSPGIGKVLVNEAKSTLLIEEALADARRKLIKHTNELQKYLSSSFPIRSRIKEWNRHKVLSFQSEFVRLNQWGAHEDAIERCRKENLEQATYFLQRDLTFMRDREPVLVEELSKVRVSTRTYSFGQRIWFPGNWVVKRMQYGETEVIPTIIVEQPQARNKKNPDSDTVFILEKSTYWKTNSSSMFWRWKNYLTRTWTWTWNAMFWLGIALPWCSPVSFRALFYKEPFIPELELNHSNGTLSPKLSSKTQTLRSRLVNIWESVAESRAKFEAEPDTGFLGKSFTRHLNRFWNYVVKGTLGSFMLVFGFAPLCLVASSGSVLAAVTSPIWMPLVTFGVHLFLLMVYDFDSPGRRNAIMYLFEAVVWRLLVLGLLQPVCAFFTATLILPVSSAAVILFGLCRRGVRGLWDTIMFNFVISKQARIPTKDTFVARRIAGPGLAAEYFFQARPEQILAAIEAKVEYNELMVWEQHIRKLVEKPKVQYKHFVKQMFVPFSADLVHQGVYEQVVRHTEDIVHEIGYQVEKRKSLLLTGLNQSLSHKIKLPSRDLRSVQKYAAELVEEFYTMRIFNRMPETQAEFWENRQLQDGDWMGLTNQLLTELFTNHFLTPLEETDHVAFRLEIQHLDLARYVQMIGDGSVHDDLDEAEPVYKHKGEIDVDAPYFNMAYFSPMKEDVVYADYLRHARRPFSHRSTLDLNDMEKLQLPVPIMHPAYIAILIFNRDNDMEEIDMDDAICRRMLKAAEDIPYTDTPTTMVMTEDSSSTPDHTTTHSESDPGVPRLAEQEVLSDYNVTSCHTEPDGAGGDTLKSADVKIKDLGRIVRDSPPKLATPTFEENLGGEELKETLEQQKPRWPGDSDSQQRKTSEESPDTPSYSIKTKQTRSPEKVPKVETRYEPSGRYSTSPVKEEEVRLEIEARREGLSFESEPNEKSTLLFQADERDTSCVVYVDNDNDENRNVNDESVIGELNGNISSISRNVNDAQDPAEIEPLTAPRSPRPNSLNLEKVHTVDISPSNE